MAMYYGAIERDIRDVSKSVFVFFSARIGAFNFSKLIR